MLDGSIEQLSYCGKCQQKHLDMLDVFSHLNSIAKS